MSSRWIRKALKTAVKSPHPKHRLGAVVVRGGALIGAACNGSRWGRCAERRALRPHVCTEGASLYVMRAGGRCSRPCAECMEAIKRAGIERVFFVNELGELEGVRT